jgi:hypothetical protein
MTILWDCARLALDVGKATFDNTFTTVATLQGWAEDGIRGLSRGSAWLPVQLQEVVDEGLGLVARSRADFKATVDRCYVLVADLLADEDDLPEDVAAHAAPTPIARARRAS